MKIYLKFVTTLKIKIPVSQILSLVGLSNFSSTNVCEVCMVCVGVVLQHSGGGQRTALESELIASTVTC